MDAQQVNRNDTGQILKKAQIRLIVTLVLLGLMIVGLGGSYWTLGLWQKKLVGLKQEAQLIELSKTSREKLLGIAANEAERVQLVLAVFPDSEGVLGVLQELEALVESVDPQGVVSFTSTVPVKVENELSIPMQLQLNTNSFEAIELMRRLERLPYVISVDTIDLDLLGGISEPAQVTIGVHLYVNDPFVSNTIK